MKPTKLLPFIALMCIFNFSCSNEEFVDETPANLVELNAPESKVIEIEILEIINNHRINIGLTPLLSNETIKAVAYTHTERMVEVNTMSHDFFYQRRDVLVENIPALDVNENVAYAYSTAGSVVEAWLNSEGHRANIEGDYTDFDISAEKNAEGKWYFTNIFIKR
ncbi:MAG: CAP domain-containing protein [Psychroserpens sp.]|uniref:CAP domain-containing protein n=1 Tax=Psychroserpens sp. TaxID=2020870 RepID=UPI003C749FE0